MALSLVADYSSDETDSDSDDGINVIINKNPQQKRVHPRAGRTLPLPRTKRPAAAQTGKVKTKNSKTESVLDNTHNPEYDDEPQESIPLPSTVLTMFDKTEEQEVVVKRVKSLSSLRKDYIFFSFLSDLYNSTCPYIVSCQQKNMDWS